MSGYLDGILKIERETSGMEEEACEKDAVYSAILSAIGGIEEALEQALEQDNLLINRLDQF
jgi:hypothetical protein